MWAQIRGEKGFEFVLFWIFELGLLLDALATCWGAMNKISLYSLNIVVFAVIVYLEVSPLSDVIKVTWELNFSRAYFLCTTVSFSSLKWSFVLLNFITLNLAPAELWFFEHWPKEFCCLYQIMAYSQLTKKQLRHRIFSIVIFLWGNFTMHLTLAVNLAYHEILHV